MLFDVAHGESTGDFRSVGEIMDEEIDKLEQLSREGMSITGAPSGFRDLDDITGGFQKSNLIVLAARPSMGKSALVTNIAENVALKSGKPVALFSLEMSVTELAQRFVASQARMPGDKLRKGGVAKNDWPKVLKACQALEKAPLWIDDSSDLDILELRAKARRLHAKEANQGRGGLGLVIVDYLQLMRANRSADSRVEQVGQMSRGLKILARELDVPVIAVSQLNRSPEQRPDKRPLLSDLRECVGTRSLCSPTAGGRSGSGGRAEVYVTSERLTTRSERCGGGRARSEVAGSGRTLRATRSPDRCGRVAAGRELAGRPVAMRAAAEPTARAVAGRPRGVAGSSSVTAAMSGQPLRYTTASEDNSRIVARRQRDSVPRQPLRQRAVAQLVPRQRQPLGSRRVNKWLRELGSSASALTEARRAPSGCE